MKLRPFKLERYFARYEFAASYLLCSSDCESMRLDELLAFSPDAGERFDSLWLGYTESQGAPSLRRAIAALYGQVAEEEILVHAGAEEAIFNFMNVVLEPGDRIVVHTPCYQSLAEVARSIGAQVVPWRGNPFQGWPLDLDELESLLAPRTKAVVVNFPHNPTGFLPDSAFVRGLSELSEKHGFLVFSDEVYRGLELDPDDRLPSFADLNERAAALGVMSKTYGLAGLRIGWIATRNRSLYKEMAAFKDYTTICNPAPSEFLAELALRNANAIVARNLAIIRRNLDLLDSFFASHAELFRWHRPKAGSVAFPALLQGGVERFCAKAVEKAGVLLLPGTLYEQGLNSFRVGFGRKNLPEALGRLAGFLETPGLA
ncbi:MAG: aminotransferase class I/II-fold pyridoxal phosphate-dependent enzyme [Thermodesulfobacteriota bacterium]